MTLSEKRAGSSQLAFSFEHDREVLVRILERTVGMPVLLVLTDNSSSMLSFRKSGAVACVRLHRMFLCADEGILKEIASFIKRGRGNMSGFRAFVNEMRDTIRRKPPRSFPAMTQGKHYDLHSIFERLNHEYFEGRLNSVITWGNSSSRKVVRKRTLGSFSSQTNIIRINPVLDKKTVPSHYLEFIVYHEMLHADMGTERRNGRRAVHTRDFRKRERAFRDFDEALRYEKTGI
ncbi:MAG: hypothetical protein HQL09_06220 [Nitrospirae bacterium]|nr:hypothetical protein [Nitrospirota bacterium]